MPDVAFWPLFITFAAAAIAATIKMVEALHGKKMAEDECSRLRAQLDILNNPTDEKALDVQIFNGVEEKQPPEQSAEITHLERLDVIREKILVIVSRNDGLRDSIIAIGADVSKQLATLHLHELKEMKFVRSKFGLDPDHHQVDLWYVTQPGRKYLNDYGLL